MSRQRGGEQTAVACQGLGYEAVIVDGYMSRQVRCNSSKDFRFCCKVMEWPKVVMDVAEEDYIHLMQSLCIAFLAVTNMREQI